MEIYNDAAIPEDEDLLHGTSEQCPGLCEGSCSSYPRHQTSAWTDFDFSARSFQGGSNSSPKSLSAVVDSQTSSDLFDKFINYPPQSSTRLPTTELPSPSPQSSPHKLHCKKCQRAFSSLNSTLQHIAGRHRLAGSGHWPCVEPNCDLSFVSDKDLRRHLMDIHLDIKYTCSCGRRLRRDKHLLHIQDAPRKCKAVGPYMCVCGAGSNSNRPTALSDHLKHITEAFFTCSCGQRHHVTDHLTHIQHQQCRHGAPYICHCGRMTESHTETGLEDHRHHVEEFCLHGPSYGLDGQPRKRGRPRKMNNESTQRRMN